MDSHAEPTRVRKVWIDYIRIIAVLAVIAGHVAVDFYGKFGEIRLFEWWFANILTPARFAVGLFVMASGAVLLGRRYTLGEFYRRRAVRLIPPLIFWNLFYVGVYILDGMDARTVMWLLRAQMFADGYTAPHLWYLSMFACLMLFVPFINQFVNGERPTFKDLSVLLGVIALFYLANSVSSIARNVFDITIDWFKIFPWFLAYFLGGYYIDKYSDKIPLSRSLIVAAIFLLTAIGLFLNYFAISTLGILKDYFVFDNASLPVLVIVSLILLLIKKSSADLKESKIIMTLSEASFGVYLIHEAFNALLVQILPGFYSHPITYIPVVTAATTVLSFSTIILLRKIPLMRAVC